MNPGPPAPHAGALPLRYAPTFLRGEGKLYHKPQAPKKAVFKRPLPSLAPDGRRIGGDRLSSA